MTFNIYFQDLNEGAQAWIFEEVKKELEMELKREVSDEEVDDYINCNNFPAQITL